MLVKRFVFCLLGFAAIYFPCTKTYAAEGLSSRFDQEDPFTCQSRPEKWLWHQVTRGGIANFNELYGPLDPKSAEGWTETRKIGSTCLEAILQNQEIGKTIIHKGVQIVGAWFPEAVNLSNFVLDRPLRIEESRFESSIYMAKLRGNSLISFDGSEIVGKLNLGSIRLDDSIYLRNISCLGEVVFTGAKINGDLDMDGSKFDNHVFLYSIEVGGSISMDSARFRRKVDLNGAKVGGQLSTECSEFDSALYMGSIKVNSHLIMDTRGCTRFDSLDLRSARIGGQVALRGARSDNTFILKSMEVGENLFMNNGEFKEIMLTGAKIRGDLKIDDSRFTGKLILDYLEVGGSVSMRNASFLHSVRMIFAKISSNLDLSWASFTNLDLSGTQIAGELRMGSTPKDGTLWEDGSKLRLRNTVIHALQDHKDAWPDDIELGGFTYERLGGVTATHVLEALNRENRWFTKWLNKDGSYTPQPYEQLAGVFREAGMETRAKDILFESRQRARREFWQRGEWLSWLWSTLELIFIGYGYRLYYAIYWFVGFILLGVGVLRVSGQGVKNKMPWGVSYSFDTLIPFVTLRKYHYDVVDIIGWPRYYFYFHQLMGYVLASFIIAGISGFTK